MVPSQCSQAEEREKGRVSDTSLVLCFSTIVDGVLGLGAASGPTGAEPSSGTAQNTGAAGGDAGVEAPSSRTSQLPGLRELPEPLFLQP